VSISACKGIPAEGSCPVASCAEVRAWVERYRRAIERKDKKALERLGLSKIEVRDSVDDAKKYEDLIVKIELQEQDIQLSGNRRNMRR
jgi:hypothetical protein